MCATYTEELLNIQLGHKVSRNIDMQFFENTQLLVKEISSVQKSEVTFNWECCQGHAAEKRRRLSFSIERCDN